MKVKEYLVDRLIKAEEELRSANRYKKMLEDENRHFQEQLNAAHEFENKVRKFASEHLGIEKDSIGDKYISYGYGEKSYVWERHDPEMYKFVRENLLWHLDDDGKLRGELQSEDEEVEPMPF